MANQKPSAGTLATTPLSGTERWGSSQGSNDRVITPAMISEYMLKNRPKLVAQQLFYSPVQSLSATSLTPVAGSYYGALFRGRPGDTFDNIAIEISTAPTTGGNVRVGLYSHDVETKLPKASAGLIYDSGSIAFTTGSFALSTTPALITLPAVQAFPADGDVWVVLQTDTVASMQWRRAGAVYGHNLLVRAVNAGALSSVNGDAGIAGTGTFGAMPSNPPTMASSGQSIPAMALYKS